ncbi:MAG TPA: DUF4389 domain-containing protein [Spirochaetota bacterium]|nr:DUF4389 domain-containing protein [Spirochaetota bacterium]HOS39667.1 DUF4389 domain-containing protein [Spirochaetota bacterium]HPI22968.1 DUF4389 domain-containing protein [Spirochaetota bacterium]HPU86941.1 DUF4389 domain-containing protein [Spirochaetota bacterium]
MIIRCTHCNSAFAVDDSKVENRKFAFTCPKCATSNIIDNRMAEKTPAAAGARHADRFGDEAPARDAKTGSHDPGDDLLDASFDEDATDGRDAAPKRKAVDDELDLGEFDIPDEDAPGEPSGAAGGAKKPSRPIAQDDEIDLDQLGLSEDEELSALINEDVAPGDDAPATKKPRGGDDIASELDDLESALRHEETLQDLEPLEEDLSFDEPKAGGAKGGGAKAGGAAAGIDVDLDGLLDDDTLGASSKEDEVFAKDMGDTDESITIDLDTLDIQLEEDAGVKKPSAMADDIDALPELTDAELGELSGAGGAAGEEDENITIDLDSLDLPLEDEGELKQGEIIDEDETITIDDAGLTMDDLEVGAPTGKSARHAHDDLDAHDDDIKLSLDEIDPTLDVNELGGAPAEGERLLTEEIDGEDLPEIDFDKFESEEPGPGRTAAIAAGAGIVGTAAGLGITAASTGRGSKQRADLGADDFLDIERQEEYARYQDDLDRDDRRPSDTVPRGAVNFSIDYSLGFTRLGAVLRLFGLYYIRLIPHAVVTFLYIALAGMVGFINWLIILFTGESSEDFTSIQEKAVRASLSLSACAADVVEDVPAFAGVKDIDYPLQFEVTYPVAYSKALAFLRLTGIGIILATLPHLIILFVLTVGAQLIGLVGLVAIIATRRWPNILFDFMIRFYRYQSNVLSFLFGLVDKYPTFRFE